MSRPRQVRRERTFTLGKTVDSADDMARLMIVTQYAGSKTVKVYASDDTLTGPTWGPRRVTSRSMIDSKLPVTTP